MKWFHEIYGRDEDSGVGRAIYRALAEGMSPGRKALSERLDLSRAELEGHLQRMKDAGLVEIRRGQGGSIHRLPRSDDQVLVRRTNSSNSGTVNAISPWRGA